MGVYLRPYLHQFLLRMSKKFEIIIFTASSKAYCDALMDKIDVNRVVSHRLYRNHCTRFKGRLLHSLGRETMNDLLDYYVKDLRTIQNWKKQDVWQTS